ncbi:MAG: cyclic nucleotide-binding domain-containing protein [Patescibacteria group bacterium]
MSILGGLELLKDLSDSQKDNLSLFCQEKFLEPGEILFHEGDDANAMYILASGEIEVSNVIQSKKIKL